MRILALTVSAFRCVRPSFNSIRRAGWEQGRKERGMKAMKTPSTFKYFLSPPKQPLAGQADFWTNNPPAKLFAFPVPSSAARKRK